MKSVMLVLPLLLVLALVSCQSTPTASQSENQSSSNPAATSQPSPAPQAKPVIQRITLPSGTVLQVRLDQALSTATNKTGDQFTVSLAAPVTVRGKEVLPQGTRFTGHVTTAESSGRLQGRGVLGITLDSFKLKGETYAVKTSLDTKATTAHKKRNIEVIGGGAGLGALIGGIVGHGKGAAIGAAAGAAAGTATAAATGKKEVKVPAETMFRFRLKSPVSVKE